MTRSRALRAASRARAEVRHFWMIALAACGFSSRKRLKAFTNHLLDVGLYFRVHQFDFGLAFKLRIRVLDADDGGHAFAGVIPGEVGVRFFQQCLSAGHSH